MLGPRLCCWDPRWPGASQGPAGWEFETKKNGQEEVHTEPTTSRARHPAPGKPEAQRTGRWPQEHEACSVRWTLREGLGTLRVRRDREAAADRVETGARVRAGARGRPQLTGSRTFP